MQKEEEDKREIHLSPTNNIRGPPLFRRQAPRLRRADVRFWGLTAQRVGQTADGAGKVVRERCRKIEHRFGGQCLTGPMLVFSDKGNPVAQ